MTTTQRHFIFGYGSLICPLSRLITAPNLTYPIALPVLIRGMTRTWSARCASRPDPDHDLKGWTAMGVSLKEGNDCTGVLIEVTSDELLIFDGREKRYTRNSVSVENVHPVPGEITDTTHVVFAKEARIQNQQPRSLLPTSRFENVPEKTERAVDHLNIWVYVQKDATPSNRFYPITQSYVDVILRGCFSIGEGFAQSFIETTNGWWNADNNDDDDDDPYNWVDDRATPLYVRADKDYGQEKAKKFDDFLKKNVPDAFGKRRRL